MAHGGHSGGSHYSGHYHHYSNYGGYWSGNEGPLETVVILVICGLLLATLVYIRTTANNSKYIIGGKEPLKGEFEVVQYIHDDGTFENVENLQEGLEYLKEKTNVQLVIETTSDEWMSNGKAVDEYYKLFDDEAHVLLIVPPKGSRDDFYYAIGDDADSVIGNKEIDYLIEEVKNSRNGMYWGEILHDFADELLKPL